MLPICVSAADLRLASIPKAYAGETLYIGGQYTTGEVVVEVYAPNSETPDVTETVEVNPDHSFYMQYKTKQPGEYKIIVKSATETADITVDVPQKPNKTAKPTVQNGINVTVNGEYVTFDTLPMLDNDRTLVPLRAVFEKMGAKVGWSDDTQTVTAERSGRKISLVIGENIITVNGEKHEIDVPAKLVEDRTMVPVRAISEAMGADVEWDEQNQTVVITDAREEVLG